LRLAMVLILDSVFIWIIQIKFEDLNQR
jgi:hypothetical protein